MPARRTVVLLRYRVARRWLWLSAAGVAVALLLGGGTGYRYRPLAPPPPTELPGPAALTTREAKGLAREQRQLREALDRKVPRGKYIVIDRTNNRLYLKQGQEVLLDAICSAGSGMVLREGEGGERTWTFDTPQGAFRVLSKTKNPVWKKPDWAFIEAGLPLPRSQSERIEYGTLGEFALYFGNGYLIHGTLYERLLGRNVSHGCIRLGRDDLRTVYQAAPVGTPIYVY
jgi:L,D-transpeptidase YbiS